MTQSITISKGDEFDTYSDFQEKLNKYGQINNVQFVITKSTTASYANKKIADPANHYDVTKLKYRFVQLQCKHGGNRRISSRGIRPNQRSFKIECPAEMKVTANRFTQKLVVLSVVMEHNHEVNPEIFKQYPEQRRLNKDTANTMHVDKKKASTSGGTGDHGGDEINNSDFDIVSVPMTATPNKKRTKRKAAKTSEANCDLTVGKKSSSKKRKNRALNVNQELTEYQKQKLQRMDAQNKHLETQNECLKNIYGELQVLRTGFFAAYDISIATKEGPY